MCCVDRLNPKPIPGINQPTVRPPSTRLSGRLEDLDLLNGQMIGYLQKASMLPPSGEARSVTERYGTYRFCKARALPMRSFEEAMEAFPSDRSPTVAP